MQITDVRTAVVEANYDDLFLTLGERADLLGTDKPTRSCLFELE